jgi:hypothetical protein
MGVTYSIPLSEDYIVETYEQHRALQKTRWLLMWPIRVLCAIGLLGLFALGVYAKIYFIAAFASFFLGLLAVGPRFDYWIMRRRWRRHPRFNEQLRLEIAEDGVSYHTKNSSGSAQWTAYSKGVIRPQGVILYSSQWDYEWLPDEAIVTGTPAEIRDLLKTKLSPQDVV